MAKNIYRGFSSANLGVNRNFALSNVDLVKQDLLNHIYTARGDRVMMPSFGTRIPLLAFEPNDENTRLIVETDLREVFTYDPRVKLISLNVFSLDDNNAIIALADLMYIELNVTDTLRLEIKTQ